MKIKDFFDDSFRLSCVLSSKPMRTAQTSGQNI